MSDEYSRPASPPPPLFFNAPERNLVKQVNDEISERIIGQNLLYYPIDLERTKFHKLYGEAIIKNFLPPIQCYGLVTFDGINEVSENEFGVDNDAKIVVKFQRRRLIEDKDLYIRVGDFICYGTRYYEIVKLEEPRNLFGNVDHRFETFAHCIKSRSSMFKAL